MYTRFAVCSVILAVLRLIRRYICFVFLIIRVLKYRVMEVHSELRVRDETTRGISWTSLSTSFTTSHAI